MSEHASKPESLSAEMTIFEHLAELRHRLFISILGILLCTGVALYFVEPILTILNRPFFAVFPAGSLIGTGPAEAFMLKLKTALFSGIILSVPLLFHQFWLFVAPGLHEHERRLVVPFVLITSFLFIGGVAFCYEVVFPFALTFFWEQYGSIGLTANIRLSEQLGFTMQGLLVFGAMFELPVVAFFLGRIGLITHHTLIGASRYAIVAIFVIAAILTPPDVLTQFLLAVPLLALYGVSIVVVWLTQKRPGASSAPAVCPKEPR